MYLLATNICIYIINRRPETVRERIVRLEPFQVKLSAVSLAELEYGVSKSRNRDGNRKALLDFAAAFDVLPFTDADAEVYGLIRADLERRGLSIGPYDLQIASQALVRGLSLVTNDTAEFSRIPGLKLENWASG